jgi:hypothetical protein
MLCFYGKEVFRTLAWFYYYCTRRHHWKKKDENCGNEKPIQLTPIKIEREMTNTTTCKENNVHKEQKTIRFTWDDEEEWVDIKF